MSETTEEKYKRFLTASLSNGGSDASTDDLLAATVAFFSLELDSLRSEVERLTASNRAIVAQRDRLQVEHEADRETIAALRAENLRLSKEVSQ